MKFLKKMMFLMVAILLLIPASVTTTVKVEAAAQVNHWKLYVDAKALYNQGNYSKAIPLIKSALKQQKNVTGYYRLLAECYEQTRQNQLAAETYYAEAKIQYQLALKSGDYNTYYAVLALAEKLNSELELYFEDTYPTISNVKLQKFEPAIGTYIGAYIEHDSNLEPLKSERYSSFNKMMDKQHATFFTYHKYGNPFPKTFADNVKKLAEHCRLH